MARDLSEWRTERVGAWIGAGGDDHLSPLRAFVQATLAVEGGGGHHSLQDQLTLPPTLSHPPMTSL